MDRRAVAVVLLGIFCALAGFMAREPNEYAAITRPEWLLVIAAFLTLGVIAWQAWETRRSVQAGLKNVELLISKDRARLQIIAGEVPVIGNTEIAIRCYLNNVGPTMAFIDGGGMALVEGARDTTVDYGRCANIPLVGDVPENSRTPTEFLVTLQPETVITDAQALEIREGK